MAFIGLAPIGYEGLEYMFRGLIFIIILSTVLDIMKNLMMTIGRGGQ